MKIIDYITEYEDGNTFMKCGHNNMEYNILLSENLKLYFLCCPECYDRLVGYLIRKLIEPIEKLAKRL